MAKYTILISDKFDQEGIRKIKEKTNLFDVICKESGLNRAEFLHFLPRADGLILRSSTKADKEAFSHAKKLKLIIRAGVGIDNIDVSEASRKGVIVENAPGGNTVSTAEHAIALLFAAARNIAQANSSVKNGNWEKSKFKGSELTGKTIGVVGLGRIGKEVVARARGLKMKVIGYDPYIPPENLEELEIELAEKHEILSRSDFITVHTPLTEDTKNLINTKNLSQLKDGVVLINAARGGIYNEEALAEGLASKKIGAAALDVFVTEPLPSSSKLRNFDNCIITPHLGASTDDAEFAVAMETVDALTEYFEKGLARNSINFPAFDPDDRDFLRPYYEGGICIGKLLGQLGKNIQSIQIKYCGEIAKHKVGPVTSAIQYGLLLPAMGEAVNAVNAPLLAKERGIQISTASALTAKGFSSYIQLQLRDSRQNVIELSYTSLRKEALVFSMFGLPLEFRPKGILLSIKNRDIPGVVGTIGSFLGKKSINIAHLELSRSAKGGDAYCIISIDELLDQGTLEALQNLENIVHANQVDLRGEKAQFF